MVSLDFQLMSEADFDTEFSFVRAFAREILFAEEEKDDIPGNITDQLRQYANGENGNVGLAPLFAVLSEWCGQSVKPLVLLIDEVDQAANYPVLVSSICKYIDEDISDTDEFPDKKAAWSSEGVVEAVSRIYDESNMLFESLQDKLDTYPHLKEMLYSMLMDGKPVIYRG